ncbi:hypothetical protein NUW54_g10470 [Trametes sanguinea]|uniref:Uncharacterized protein n=1 Tax=Trametes sanguinea TaxID=158606 RepID=A0ACC1NZ08_9APHY|nr:hypothetical protein NUW54_g10470 [Trametes sanguinea]
MIGDSYPEYVFISISILGLRSIAPLSILYVALSWYYGHFLYSWWLGMYAAAEAAFYLLVFLPRSKMLQKAASHPPLPSREEREALFKKCFDRVSDSEKAYGWFFSAPPDGIKRENIVEWLLWAIFGTHREGLKEEWAEELQMYVQKMEDLMGRKIEEGWDQTVRCMKVTLDPVDMIHRPLLWYFIVATIDTITAVQMKNRGFEHYTSSHCAACFPPRTFTAFSNNAPHPDLVYWLRPHKSTTKDPILFLHGIGIGLWPYVPFFGDLVEADPDVGIIAIENLSISMRISKPPLSRTEMLEALLELVDTRISHVVLARIAHAHRLESLTLHGTFEEPCSASVVFGSDHVIDGVHTFLPHLEEFRFIMRPKLRRLDLGCCPWDLVHSVLPDLTNLRALRVRIANLNDASLRALLDVIPKAMVAIHLETAVSAKPLHEYAPSFSVFRSLAMLHLNGNCRRPQPNLLSDKEYQVQTELWASSARSIARVLPSIDFVGWHGEHYVVVRGSGANALDSHEKLELKELPSRRRLDCAKGVDLGTEDAAWMERKDLPMDYEMPGLQQT